jgi:hypothetical protein
VSTSKQNRCTPHKRYIWPPLQENRLTGFRSLALREVRSGVTLPSGKGLAFFQARETRDSLGLGPNLTYKHTQPNTKCLLLLQAITPFASATPQIFVCLFNLPHVRYLAMSTAKEHQYEATEWPGLAGNGVASAINCIEQRSSRPATNFRAPC